MVSESVKLELLVAKIQAALAPSAEILHDVKLTGRHTERKRQIDVLLKQSVGQFEIMIAIECKDYKRPVDVKGVEEFQGLLDDVGACKGVLVCPAGFTSSAKTRAEGLQIDLFSPVDTDEHKWQVKPMAPAICDYRSAAMSFGIRSSAPAPFMIPNDFYSSVVAHSAAGKELGTIYDAAIKKWNTGGFPSEVGTHERLPVFEEEEVLMDNGYGQLIPISISVSLYITQRLYYGLLPIPQISGFRNEQTGEVITNAFSVGILDPDQVENEWEVLSRVDEAPITPAFYLTGLIGWVH